MKPLWVIIGTKHLTFQAATAAAKARIGSGAVHCWSGGHRWETRHSQQIFSTPNTTVIKSPPVLILITNNNNNNSNHYDTGKLWDLWTVGLQLLKVFFECTQEFSYTLRIYHQLHEAKSPQVVLLLFYPRVKSAWYLSSITFIFQILVLHVRTQDTFQILVLRVRTQDICAPSTAKPQQNSPSPVASI